MALKLNMRKQGRKWLRKDRDHEGGCGTVKDCSTDSLISGDKDLNPSLSA